MRTILLDKNSLSHRGLPQSLEQAEMCCVGEEVKCDTQKSGISNQLIRVKLLP